MFTNKTAIERTKEDNYEKYFFMLERFKEAHKKGLSSFKVSYSDWSDEDKTEISVSRLCKQLELTTGAEVQYRTKNEEIYMDFRPIKDPVEWAYQTDYIEYGDDYKLKVVNYEHELNARYMGMMTVKYTTTEKSRLPSESVKDGLYQYQSGDVNCHCIVIHDNMRNNSEPDMQNRQFSFVTTDDSNMRHIKYRTKSIIESEMLLGEKAVEELKKTYIERYNIQDPWINFGLEVLVVDKYLS